VTEAVVQHDGVQLLRSVGLRVTKPRTAVLDALRRHPHTGVDRIATDVRAALGSVSTQAVYDVLSACTAAGLLRRIDLGGTTPRYELRTEHDHHHRICRQCGGVFDIALTAAGADGADLGEALADEGLDNGFVVDAVEVVFWGTCRDCLARDERPSQHSAQPGRTDEETP